MAPRINPSKGGKPDKLIRDALMIALKRETTDENGNKITYLNKIAAKVVTQAASGDMGASKEIFDRVDGKSLQGLAISGDGDGSPVVVEYRPAGSREAWLLNHGNPE